MPNISYAITVCNESEELYRLLQQLQASFTSEDEIVIQGDQGNVTHEVVTVLHGFIRHPQITYIEYPLNRDFATFKNNLFKNCTKEWIFQIDADEVLATALLRGLKDILTENADVEMFRVPRVNIVENLTDQYIKQWGWSVNNRGWVNWPDKQCRISRNLSAIRWQNKVHEVLTGYKSWADLPIDPDYALIHVKQLDRQVQQNEFYSTIQG